MTFWQSASWITIPSFLEGPIIQLKSCSTFNPTTFLPESLQKPEHDYHEVLSLNYSPREDLKDKPLENPDETMFTNGFSFMGKGECKVGYAMVALSKILESNLLPSGTSAQLGELIALTQSLRDESQQESEYLCWLNMLT